MNFAIKIVYARTESKTHSSRWAKRSGGKRRNLFVFFGKWFSLDFLFFYFFFFLIFFWKFYAEIKVAVVTQPSGGLMMTSVKTQLKGKWGQCAFLMFCEHSVRPYVMYISPWPWKIVPAGIYSNPLTIQEININWKMMFWIIF